MLLQFISLSLLFTVSFAVKESPVDFCNPEWCPYQGTHIACNNAGVFGDKCTGAYWLVNLKKYRKLILKLHNQLRNEIALGKVSPYEPAVRMPILRWDKSLQKMAELNVKTCSFKHDQCRSTTKFPYVGQNIFTIETTRLDYTIEDFIRKAIEEWFLQHKNGDMDIIYGFTDTKPPSDSFTKMMIDRNDRIGCAFLYTVIPRSFQKWLIKIMITCNYPSTNIYRIPTYEAGPAGSFCKETDSVYKGLCCEDEIIDPNNYIWYFE